MKAYSFGLRQRVAAACVEAGRTQGQVAAQFQVSPSFATKLLPCDVALTSLSFGLGEARLEVAIVSIGGQRACPEEWEVRPTSVCPS